MGGEDLIRRPGQSLGTASSVGYPFQVRLLGARGSRHLGLRPGESPAQALVLAASDGRVRRGRRAKGQRLPRRPRVAGAVGGGRRAEGEGSHLGEVPGWSQPPGAERFSCPPRLSPADPERSFPEKNAPRFAGPRSRPEPLHGKGAAPRHAGRVWGPRSWVRTDGMSGPPPRSRGERSPLRPAVLPAREEGAAAAGALDVALSAERCGAAPIQGRRWFGPI